MEKNSATEEHVVFIGNLKKDRSKKELKDSIYDLFTRFLHINIDYDHIKMKGKSNKPRHAFVHVRSKEDLKKAVDMLGSLESRSQLKFGFLYLVEPSEILKVGEKRPGVDNSVKNHSEKTQRQNNNSQMLFNEPKPVIDTGKHPAWISGHSVLGVNKTALPLSQKSAKGQFDAEKIRYYVDGEKLGNETRNKEFKEASGDHYIKKNLKDHVGKYVCGFLNSSQEGTLFIGVKDNGNVVGIECDQKSEDNIRIRIDQTIKTIKPVIFPQNYHVEFVPVITDNGDEKVNYKVIEITVHKVDDPTQLYEVSGVVFVRRDGSTETLKPSGIQEWCKQAHQKDLKARLERQEQELQQKAETEKTQAIKDIEVKLQQKAETDKTQAIKDIEVEHKKHKEEKDKEIRKLQQKITIITEENKHLKNHKSKVCVIS